MMGFHHTLDGGGRGLHAQRSARGDCSVSSGVLSPGFIRRGVGVWKRTFAAARRCGDRLAHTAFIPGGLPTLHRHKTCQERCGVIRPRVQGRPTAAPTSGPFWPRCSTKAYAINQVNTNESQTMHREAPHHQVRGRNTVRANQSRETASRPDVARRAGRVGGNQFDRRIIRAEGRVGFLPAVNGGVSISGER